MPLSTAQLLRRAEHAGAPIGKFCQLIYQQQGEIGIRRILGVLSLMKKYGAAAVEDACATAIDIGVHEYRFVRRYLERRPHPQMFLRQIDPLIRQLTVSRDFITLKTDESPESISSSIIGLCVNYALVVWPRCWKHDCSRPKQNRWCLSTSSPALCLTN